MPEAVLAPFWVAEPTPIDPAHTRTATIMSVATELPEQRLTSAALAERLGIEEKWILSRTGIRERRVARPDERLSDFAARAGARALTRAKVDAADLDLVIVATMSQDEFTPNSAPIVAHELGAINAGAFDVGAACTAFLSGLALAAAQIECGRAERVLLIGADLISRFTNYDDKFTAPLFADAAGAAVLGAVPAARPGSAPDRSGRSCSAPTARTRRRSSHARDRADRDGRARGVPRRREPDERGDTAGRRARRGDARRDRPVRVPPGERANHTLDR